MKTLPFKRMLLSTVFCSIIINCPVFAQPDTARISYSQENADSSDYNYQRKYQYLDINLKDETKMFKVAIPAFGITYYDNVSGNSISRNNFGLLISFERKIYPSLSVIIENENNYTRDAAYEISNYFLTSSLNWGARYYFFMDKRIKEGISGNNLNGVYVDLTLRELNEIRYTNMEYQSTSSKLNYDYLNFIPLNVPDLRLSLGLQKRLSNFAYMDARFFLSFTPDRVIRNKVLEIKSLTDPTPGQKFIYKNETEESHFMIGLDFRIGLGWGWK
jgi:hypothetical protein